MFEREMRGIQNRAAQLRGFAAIVDERGEVGKKPA
jgi:hypothetical protein